MGGTWQIVSIQSARKNSDDVRSGILIEMCPEHIKTDIHFNLTRLPDYAVVRSEIETFLETRQSSSNPDAMDTGSLNGKVFVAIADTEGIGQQSAPNVARVVKEAKVRMARDRARRANQAKGKLMMARRKAKVTNGKHARHLKDIAITVGNGVTWKRIVSQKPKPMVKAKVRVASMNLKRVHQKSLQLGRICCVLVWSVAILAQEQFFCLDATLEAVTSGGELQVFCFVSQDPRRRSVVDSSSGNGMVVVSTELECWQCTGLLQLVDGVAMVVVWHLFWVER